MRVRIVPAAGWGRVGATGFTCSCSSRPMGLMRDHWERRSDGTPIRVVRESGTGRKWRVWVADTQEVPGAIGGECLIFDSGDVMRRAWSVPADWAKMPPDVLLELPRHGGRAD